MLVLLSAVAAGQRPRRCERHFGTRWPDTRATREVVTSNRPFNDSWAASESISDALSL